MTPTNYANTMPKFGEAFAAVLEELEWQAEVWGAREPGAESGGAAFDRTLDEYTLYINRYAGRLAAENCVTRHDYENKMHTVRKIAALAVACLALEGVLTRTEENEL